MITGHPHPVRGVGKSQAIGTKLLRVGSELIQFPSAVRSPSQQWHPHPRGEQPWNKKGMGTQCGWGMGFGSLAVIRGLDYLRCAAIFCQVVAVSILLMCHFGFEPPQCLTAEVFPGSWQLSLQCELQCEADQRCNIHSVRLGLWWCYHAKPVSQPRGFNLPFAPRFASKQPFPHFSWAEYGFSTTLLLVPLAL